MSESVRVRFAPSPTGHLHIGNVRTAILNWIFARHAAGQFVLRIEDTDAERSTEESERHILQDLRWLGLEWDEGPDTGGEYGPYRQSERLPIYARYIRQLREAGHAYDCYCTPQELESMRATALAEKRTPGYDGRCRALSREQIAAYQKEGRQPVVRLKVPARKICFHDLVKGEVSFPAGDLGDFVIARADGMPTYNFAVVIDDALMQISHVVRGDDHVANTPKQLAVYGMLDWTPPAFAHIPMILGPDRTRLSKRHGATSVEVYARKGYLPEAVVNYLSLLSWSSESGEEILSRERLIREFDFARVSRSPAVFDAVKLTWMNGVYIRQTPLPELVRLCRPFLEAAGYDLPDDPATLALIVGSVQEKLEVLEDVVAATRFYFSDAIAPQSPEAENMLRRESTQKVFWSFVRQAELYDRMTAENFKKSMKTVGKETGVMGKDLWMPVRIALTGQQHGPELPQIVEIYGKEKCIRLLKKWVNE